MHIPHLAANVAPTAEAFAVLVLTKNTLELPASKLSYLNIDMTIISIYKSTVIPIYYTRIRV